MRSTRTLIILALVTAAAVVGAWYAVRPQPVVERTGEPLLPGLLARVNDATRIEVTHKGKSFAIERSDSGWGVVQRKGYPADEAAVRTLLVGAARLTRLEPKTANPELYPKIGLGDPTKEKSKSTAIKVLGADGEVLVNLIVGERRFGHAGAANEYFVRIPGQPKSWLVSGTLPTAHVMLDWLDKTIVAVDHQRVHTVEVTHPDGEVVAVERGRGDADYRLRSVPAGRKPEGAWKINDVGRMLEDLKLEDVLPVAEANFDEAKPGPKLVMTTYDGLRIVMRTARDGGRTLARLDAEFDPSLVEPAPESGAKAAAGAAADENGAGKGTGGESKTGSATDGKDPDGKDASGGKDGAKHDEAAVRGEAARLSARWGPWVYVLPSFKAGYLDQRMNDLLAPEGGDKGKGDGAAAQPSG